MTRIDGTMDAKYSDFIAYVAVTDNTPIVSRIIDTADALEVTMLVHCHAAADTDTTVTAVLAESDESNMGNSNSVADEYMFGTEAGLGLKFDSETKVAKLGYKGHKRYIQLTLTPANNSGSISMSGIVRRAYTYKNANTTQLQTI